MDELEGGKLQTKCTRIIIDYRLRCFDLTDPDAIQDARFDAIKKVKTASAEFRAATLNTANTSHDAYIRHVLNLIGVPKRPATR